MHVIHYLCHSYRTISAGMIPHDGPDVGDIILRQSLQPLRVCVHSYLCVCVMFMHVLLFTCYNAAISAK